MSQNYQQYLGNNSSNINNGATSNQHVSQSTNNSQSFSVASALGGGFNPRIISNYGGYETYQYTSTANNASPVVGVPTNLGISSFISGITVSNTVPGGGGGAGGVSTGFINETNPQVLSSTSSTRPSQQAQSDSITTTADYIYKNDYNYGQQISQQIAADLVALNRGGAGNSGTAGIGGAVTSTPSSSNTVANTANLSSIEAAILRSTVPIEIAETEEITVNGQRGIWANKSEVVNWRGLLPITDYSINQDSQPEVITKKSNQQLVYQQEVAIRYLRPPTPPPPGEIIIQQEMNTITPPAPPLIIRQQPPRPITPQPLVVREAPPPPPAQVGKKVITISGKRIPPPPRKVVIERLAPLPSKPQSVIIERWLPYSQVKRRVIFQKSNTSDPVVVKPRNVIIQWEAPQVTIKKEFKDLGVIRANPSEYVARYGATLKTARELPPFVLEIKPPAGVVLAADYQYNSVYELEGDVQALRLVDLDREGLTEYKQFVSRLNTNNNVSSSSPNNVYSAEQQQQQPIVINTTAAAVLSSSSANQQQQQQQQQQQSAPLVYTDQYYNQSSFGVGAAPVKTAATTTTTTSTLPDAITTAAAAANLQAAGVPPQPVTGAQINEIFATVDRDQNGRITSEEGEKLLLRLNSRIGRRYGEEDVKRFFDSLDFSKDGQIDLAEFRRVFESQL